MVNKVKKGTKGKASKYVTRTKAIRKLDIPLKDFRKLSILKGVFPRQPNKKLSNSSKTYYHAKDIQFLAKDKLIDHFKSLNNLKKKMFKAIVKRDKLKVQKLKRNKPQLDLNHIVKERYPTFTDALKDLDDPLTLLSLLSKFPVHRLFKISPEKVEIAKILTLIFKNFVVSQQLLSKVFLSIKGIYFQAIINNQKVTWIEPYPFATTLPFDVDYKIILTFTEVHQVILKFVLFKLFKENNLVYPPVVQNWEDSESSLPENQSTFQNMHLINAETIAEDEKQEVDPQFVKKTKSDLGNKKLFNGLCIFISREVQKDLFEFCLKSFSGKVIYHIDNFESDAYKDPRITHVLVDKPLDFVDQLPNREYVQPQWVCDSINFNVLLPTSEYIPGKALPPHLSPFVEDEKEGFVSDRKKQILQYQGEYVEESVGESDYEVQEEDETAENKTEEPHFKVIAEKFDHVKIEKAKIQKEKRKSKEEEKLSELMLSKKKQRLLNKIKNFDEKKKEKLSEIVKRKKELKEKK